MKRSLNKTNKTIRANKNS